MLNKLIAVTIFTAALGGYTSTQAAECIPGENSPTAIYGQEALAAALDEIIGGHGPGTLFGNVRMTNLDGNMIVIISEEKVPEHLRDKWPRQVREEFCNQFGGHDLIWIQ